MMAAMVRAEGPYVRLLDPGAGTGSLLTAVVEELLRRGRPPESIEVTAYEIDKRLIGYLNEALDICSRACAENNVAFSGQAIQEDFMSSAELSLRPSLFDGVKEEQRFDCVVMNPPYGKIHGASAERIALRRLGLETGNLYTGFLYLATRLLGAGGDLVAIVPRSFANGPYFERFRKWFLRTVRMDRIHVFDSREAAFKDHGVLQENIIVQATKLPNAQEAATITITSSRSADDDEILVNEVEASRVVRPDDCHAFIRLLTDGLNSRVDELYQKLPCTLVDLGVEVSTGRVVDFRARDLLRKQVDAESVPLIYPHDLANGWVSWPSGHSKKPAAIDGSAASADLLVGSGYYVLAKRFTSKEERRRLVAAVYDPKRFLFRQIGIENHLNYIHRDGSGLSQDLAKGLAAYLNSTFADMAFRLFSGHTQVNAADLRSMRYPTKAQLESLGRRIPDRPLSNDEFDEYVFEELQELAEKPNPISAKSRIEEALAILDALGLPRAQQNERSALTLLALTGLRPEDKWQDASAPLMGITPMMTFFEEHYGKKYAPNTRETVRRQTVHQFVDAGIAIPNPDEPGRPTNSPKAVYQIEPSVLDLLRIYGTPDWDRSLRAYLASTETLSQRYKQERALARIPVTVGPGKTITLSPGGQNVLIERIIHEFGERFTPGGQVLYVGDTDEKMAYVDEPAFANLGIKLDPHGKMPDVIIYYPDQQWLVLIEAVTSHGPVDPKRRAELQQLFAGARTGLVFVTAFLTRKALMEYLVDISWETEVWVAESPDHLIHFDGERFLGPE
jgi:adenine-specific DNA-methyltransferase